jgi:hypothetical protein
MPSQPVRSCFGFRARQYSIKKIMKSTRTVKRAILASIVIALCFSAGEGLRLFPLPVSLVEQIQLNDVPRTLEAVPIKYGPVDQPQSVSGKIKTKLPRVDCVTATGVNISLPAPIQSIEIAAITNAPAREPYARPIGRAPPSP